MSKWHEKLDVTDPELVIGRTPTGEPIWLDMRELLTSPDEQQELEHNTVTMQRGEAAHKMAQDVVEQGCKLMQQTIRNMLDCDAFVLMAAMSHNELIEHISRLGFTCIQDGLTTVVKRHGTVLRTMTAKVPPMWAAAVEQHVRAIVRGNAAKAA